MFRFICRIVAAVALIIVVLIGTAAGSAPRSTSSAYSMTLLTMAMDSLIALAAERAMEKIGKKSDRFLTRARGAIRGLRAIVVARWRNSA